MQVNRMRIALIGGSVATMSAAFTVRHAAVGPSKALLHQLNANPLAASYPYTRQGQQSRLFMGFLKDLFESSEAAPQEEILKAFQDPKATVIDVRSPGEITTQVDAKNWINTPGTPFNCPMLEKEADQLLPDKKAPVILYCASGKRSQKAAQILKDQDYQQVFNAGGIGGLNYLPIKAV